MKITKAEKVVWSISFLIGVSIGIYIFNEIWDIMCGGSH